MKFYHLYSIIYIYNSKSENGISVLVGTEIFHFHDQTETASGTVLTILRYTPISHFQRNENIQKNPSQNYRQTTRETSG